MKSIVEADLKKLPQSSGGGQIGCGSTAHECPQSAQTLADQMKDSFVSTEHLSPGADESRRHRLESSEAERCGRSRRLERLKTVRGSQSVTDQSPEDKYQALKKYGKDSGARQAGKN
ncbi:MAG: hypothetical protein U0872_01765 [Planctomycetaceae bacterium]